MRSILTLGLALALMMGLASPAVGDNYIKNGDFKEDSQMWHGDGHATFLKPDGTEGEEGDPGVVPVLKVTLTPGESRTVYQDVRMSDMPSQLLTSVDVYTSADFKRSTHAEDYQGDIRMPPADFMIRFMPNYYSRTFSLKPGEWTTIKSTYYSPRVTNDMAIYFFIPPGTGVIYLKAASLTQ